MTLSMEPPLVSIMMPVFNSMSYARSNGYRLLPQALDSLLAQTHSNLELIILDNQSTDETSTICNDYAQKDPRIRFVRDSAPHNPHEASSKLATMAQGKYCVYAGDDDLWHPEYITRMVEFLELHENVTMAYSNACWVDVEGKIEPQPMVTPDAAYTQDFSSLFNFCSYAYHANVIPPIFGVYRTRRLNELLPFETFDETIANVDNLFLLKFFLKDKCHFLDEILFFYRKKHRYADPKGIHGLPGNETPLLIWIYYVRHQLYFSNKIHALVDQSDMADREKDFTRCVLQDSFLLRCFNLLMWVKQDYIDKDPKLLKPYLKLIAFLGASERAQLLQASSLQEKVLQMRNGGSAFLLESDMLQMSRRLGYFLELVDFAATLSPNETYIPLVTEVRDLLKKESVKISQSQRMPA